MNPLLFNLQSAIPGEGAAFFLLTRGENSDQAPYGFIEAVEMGRCFREKLEVPEEMMLFIGADGHKKCGSYYKRFLPERVATACYTPFYGALPVGPAFDLAVAALSIKNKKVWPSPNIGCDNPGIKIVSDEQALGNRPICCLKIGGGGELGKIVLAPFPSTIP
jgi:3-oxoacyl-[acyl-carrier-protein] synthase II